MSIATRSITTSTGARRFVRDRTGRDRFALLRVDFDASQLGAVLAGRGGNILARQAGAIPFAGQLMIGTPDGPEWCATEGSAK